MNNITLPKNIEFQKGKNKNQGLVIIGPCYPGYGITLGNPLRRILLSSLPGAAVIGVKIKGADHEFMSLQHVKEDVLEIILNLKQLRLKVYSDEVVKLKLDVHGEKKVKAGDISKNSLVEIINQNLTLANITEMAGSLNMEIFVSQGRGYETTENREKDEKHETGYIEIDSVFSPVLAVSVNIEHVRVGKITNQDKIILNITTDGTITLKEAFNQAVSILIEQINALAGKDNKTEKNKKIKKETKKIKKKSEDESEKTEKIIEEENKEDEDEKKPKKKKAELKR